MFHFRDNVSKARQLVKKKGKHKVTKVLLMMFWPYIVAGLLAVFGIIMMFVVIIAMIDATSLEQHCSSGGGGSQSYSANFSIKGNSTAKAIEKWSAEHHLNAAQTAGILGNCQAESTMGEAANGNNYLGLSYGSNTVGHNYANTSVVPKYLDFFIKHTGNDPNASGTWKKYKAMTHEGPYKCGYWWGVHEEADAAKNNGTRGQYAQGFYKQIAGGHTSGTDDASSTADSGDSSSSSSSGSCGSSNSGDSGDSTDEIQFGKKYLGLDYSEHTHVAGAEDIAKGKSKSDTSPTDCSGFVWGVLKHCGYGTTSSPWTVGSGDAENTYFKEHHETVSSSDTHAGSVVMANGVAHTAILMEKWHGGKTKVIEEGGAAIGKDRGDGQGDCNDDQTYSYAFGSGNPPSEFANPKKS